MSYLTDTHRNSRDPQELVEGVIAAAVEHAGGSGCPPKLAAAMQYSLFPGGARIRPRLCLAVGAACENPLAAVAAAAAIEMLHCASLVHDDLPCFDDAETRRGKRSVHREFGERLAVLVGDALIVMAFDTVAAGVPAHRLGAVLRVMSDGVGAKGGIIGGQAWECEPAVSLSAYQRAKTGSLFATATRCGAAAAGFEPDPWREVGERIGEAYQVADDMRDVTGSDDDLGKPAGQDARLGRPSAVESLGIAGARSRLKTLVEQAVEAIPECPGRVALREQMAQEAGAFLSRALSPRPAA